MSRDLSKIQSEAQRLQILLALDASPGGIANGEVMQMALQLVGYPLTMTRLRAEVDWLAEAKLVAVEEINDGLFVVQLLEAGEDAAHGRTTVAGVKRPRRPSR